MWQIQYNTYPSIPGPINEESLEDLIFKQDKEPTCCLQQINMSHSSIFLDPYYPFPVITDVDLYTSPEREPPFKVEFDDFGQWKYLQHCRDNGIKPLLYIKEIFSENNTLCDLKAYPEEISVVLEALSLNTTITDISFENIDLSPTTILDLLTTVLTECSQIARLNLKNCLSNCTILPDHIFSNSKSLIELDLSSNSLGNNIPVLSAICNDLTSNQSIKKIILAHNCLGDSSYPVLTHYLYNNETVESIDLSWNMLNKPKGQVLLYKNLSEFNRSLKELILKWNGLKFVECIRPLAKYLRETTSLENLDLSYNLINETAVRALRGSFLVNSTIKAINLSFNPLGVNGTQSLLQILLEEPSKNRNLVLDNCYVNATFAPTLKKIDKNENKSYTIGGILSKYTLQTPDMKSIVLARVKYLTESKRKNKLKKRNFGQFLNNILLRKRQENVNKDSSSLDLTMDKVGLLTALRKYRIKIDNDLLNAIIAQWAFSSRFDVQKCLDDYLVQYPETILIDDLIKVKKKPSKKNKIFKISDESNTLLRDTIEAEIRNQTLNSMEKNTKKPYEFKRYGCHNSLNEIKEYYDPNQMENNIKRMPQNDMSRVYYKIDDNSSVLRFVDHLFKKLDHVIQRYGIVVREPMGATVNLASIHSNLDLLLKLKMVNGKLYRFLSHRQLEEIRDQLKCIAITIGSLHDVCEYVKRKECLSYKLSQEAVETLLTELESRLNLNFDLQTDLFVNDTSKFNWSQIRKRNELQQDLPSKLNLDNFIQHLRHLFQ